jgi:uncharacterized protein YdaU (DUF1376 family)
MWFYGFNLGEYLRDTAHLSELEDLAYRRMLDVYYRDEGPLQGSVEDVARAIRMRDRLTEVGDVLAEFFENTGKGWRQKRCEREIAEYRRSVRNKVKAGKASAEARAAERANTKATGVQQGGNRRSAGRQRKGTVRSTKQPQPQPQPQPPTPSTRMDGRMDGGSLVSVPEGEGVGTAVPRTGPAIAGDVAAKVLAGVRP